jgi:hypothetical protein
LVEITARAPENERHVIILTGLQQPMKNRLLTFTEKSELLSELNDEVRVLLQDAG